MTKYLTRDTWGRKGLFWFLALCQSLLWWRKMELEAGGHITPSTGKQRDKCWWVTHFLLLLQSWIHGIMPTTVRMDHLSSDSLRIHRYTWGVFPRWFKFSQVDSEEEPLWPHFPPPPLFLCFTYGNSVQRGPSLWVWEPATKGKEYQRAKDRGGRTRVTLVNFMRDLCTEPRHESQNSKAGGSGLYAELDRWSKLVGMCLTFLKHWAFPRSIKKLFRHQWPAHYTRLTA